MSNDSLTMSGNILGITPARGGSKGIPGKNIKAIAGKPLIAWTVEAAKRSTLIDKYIVSTEHDEIAKIVRDSSIHNRPYLPWRITSLFVPVGR